MLLEIDDNKTIGDLQENFNESFPFLKIEFYDRRYRSLKDYHSLFPLASNVRIVTVRKKHDPGICTIKSWYKVETVEEDLWINFGLNARIFHYQGNKWVLLNGGETLAAKVNSI
ncbi:MAG TPA: hypothetical protein VJ499_10445 [Flavisolibacter sp.]|nr:hypothetical protein [Flavisolibacter sp.]